MNTNKMMSKAYKAKIATLMVIVIAISLFPLYSLASFLPDKKDDVEQKLSEITVLSDTKEELEKAKKEKEQKEQELKAAESQLKATNDNLKSLQHTQSSYQGQMNTLNSELQLVADKLTVLEVQMDLKKLEIDETRQLLEETMRLQQTQYENMKKRIKFLYERGNDLSIEVLMSADDFAQFLNYADYIEKINAYDRRQLDEYIETGKTVSENMVALEKEYDELKELESQALAEQGKVSGLISKTADNIAATADSINSVSKEAQEYEKNCDKKAAEAAAANAEYEAIKAQYEEELRLAAIARASAWRDISEVTFEEGDRYLLANLIYCEAGNQSYEGQLAVGAVVINRLLSSRYPNTVTGVIYQYKQFSPVRDGHLASALANNKATANCYAAADAAMGGTTNVGNCLYFRTPIEGLTGMQIGAHIFY